MIENVFLSWAHCCPEWTAPRRCRWRNSVIEFGRLLDQYVDVEADFFRATEPGVDWTAVPDDLARVSRYPVSTLDFTGIEPLLRRLLRVPEVRKNTHRSTLR